LFKLRTKRSYAPTKTKRLRATKTNTIYCGWNEAISILWPRINSN